MPEPSAEPNAQTREETVGMRVVFWTWMAIIVMGLAVMIITPLGGN